MKKKNYQKNHNEIKQIEFKIYSRLWQEFDTLNAKCFYWTSVPANCTRFIVVRAIMIIIIIPIITLFGCSSSYILHHMQINCTLGRFITCSALLSTYFIQTMLFTKLYFFWLPVKLKTFLTSKVKKISSFTWVTSPSLLFETPHSPFGQNCTMCRTSRQSSGPFHLTIKFSGRI